MASHSMRQRRKLPLLHTHIKIQIHIPSWRAGLTDAPSKERLKLAPSEEVVCWVSPPSGPSGRGVMAQLMLGLLPFGGRYVISGLFSETRRVNGAAHAWAGGGGVAVMRPTSGAASWRAGWSAMEGEKKKYEGTHPASEPFLWP